MTRGSWGTRFGFYLVAAGSAFGLGNLWRFPYIVSENGGGAFVLLYVFLVFIIGMPFLIGELLLGKTTRSSVLRATEKLSVQVDPTLVESKNISTVNQWMTKAVGPLSVILCLIVLAYYSVISGWVLHFFMQFLVSFFHSEGLQGQRALQILLDKGWLQILLTSVHLLVVMIIVAREVEEGIERWVGYMMPVFIGLLLVLTYKSLSLDSSPAALRFFLYPDFSKLSISSFAQALGHVFFTLSIGFGTMVTFGSYMRQKAYVPLAGFRVAAVDSFISIFAGMMLFPLVFVSEEPIEGLLLLFQTVPALLSKIPGGTIFGLGFFLCLYLAALGASIGLLETMVANLREGTKIKRTQAAWWAGGISFVLALIPALSTSYLGAIQYGGRGLLEILDAALINWLLPIAALVISQVVCYRLKSKIKEAEFLDENSPTSIKLYSHWLFVLKWLAVPIISLALILQAIGLFL